MNIYKKGLIGLFLIAGAVLLVACGGGMSEMSSEAYAPAMDMPAEPMEMEEGAMSFDAVDSDGSSANIGVAQQTLPQERLIIRTADLHLVVTDTDDALRLIGNMANENGGWIVSSDVYQYDDNAKTGNITIRIPSEGFDSALEALQAMAVEVRNVNTSGQDVTEEYVDLSSRLANLEATADRVRGFLDETENVEEALAVNQELSRLESEIEVIKGRMQYLSQSASFSTISVQLTPDVLSQPIEVGGWQPTGVIRDAVEALIEALQALATFAIWFVIYILPIGIIILAPIWLLIRFVRNRRRQNRKNAEETAVSEPTPTVDES